MKRQSERPKRFVSGPIGKAVGAAALGAAATAGSAAFAPLLARAAPLLSEYIPQDLAIKGLSKISPKLGKFVDDALNSGFDFDEAKDFLGKQIKESQEPAKQDKNIIERVSPELHAFMSDQIKQGRNGYQAGAIAQKDKRFSSVIDKLQKEHKVSWADIIEQVYGQGAAPKKQGMMQQESDRFNQQYGEEQQQQPQGQQPGQQQQQQQGQPGPGMQAISAVLNKINQKLGG